MPMPSDAEWALQTARRIIDGADHGGGPSPFEAGSLEARRVLRRGESEGGPIPAIGARLPGTGPANVSAPLTRCEGAIAGLFGRVHALKRLEHP